MDYVEGIVKAIELGLKQPGLIIFLAPLGLVGFALYVVLQAIKTKDNKPG